MKLIEEKWVGFKDTTTLLDNRNLRCNVEKNTAEICHIIVLDPRIAASKGINLGSMAWKMKSWDFSELKFKIQNKVESTLCLYMPN